MNLLNSFPRLMVLAFFIFFLVPIVSLVWSEAVNYSEIITTVIFVVWFYWDAKKGSEEAIHSN